MKGPWEKRELHREFWEEKLNGGGHLGELRVGKRTVLKWILKRGGRQDGDWIHVAENKDFCVAYNAGNFLASVVTINSVTILFHAVIYT
jgi:hypothetical protein